MSGQVPPLSDPIYPPRVAALLGIMGKDTRNIGVAEQTLNCGLNLFTHCDIGLDEHSFFIKST